MVSYERKAIFIHIPKGGGTSIEQLIWPIEQGRSEADLWMGFKDKYHNKYQTVGCSIFWPLRFGRSWGRMFLIIFLNFVLLGTLGVRRSRNSTI
jgi:hypothetical protein